jgi:L-asparagine transporter-like permease
MSQESQAEVGGSAQTPPEKKYLSVRQAALIGVGAMVGAGIFALVLAVVFNLDSIASIGSAVALVIFTMITAAHLRIRSETGANLLMLVLAIVAAGAVFVTFVFTTLIHEPASIATLAGILVLSVALDYGWKHFRDIRTKNVQLVH